MKEMVDVDVMKIMILEDKHLMKQSEGHNQPYSDDKVMEIVQFFQYGTRRFTNHEAESHARYSSNVIYVKYFICFFFKTIYLFICCFWIFCVFFMSK
jgi:hypothetical protein